MNPETVSLALVISVATNFVVLISWSWSRSRLRRLLRAAHVCLNCGRPQQPRVDTFHSCPRCQSPGERGLWLEI